MVEIEKIDNKTNNKKLVIGIILGILITMIIFISYSYYQYTKYKQYIVETDKKCTDYAFAYYGINNITKYGNDVLVNVLNHTNIETKSNLNTFYNECFLSEINK